MAKSAAKCSACEHMFCASNVGMALIIVGLTILAKNMGWLADEDSFWSVLFVLLGLFFLITKK